MCDMQKNSLMVSLDTSSLSQNNLNSILSHDVASVSDITLCNKICKPLVVYRFTGNVLTSITTLRK